MQWSSVRCAQPMPTVCSSPSANEEGSDVVFASATLQLTRILSQCLSQLSTIQFYGLPISEPINCFLCAPPSPYDTRDGGGQERVRGNVNQLRECHLKWLTRPKTQGKAWKHMLF